MLDNREFFLIMNAAGAVILLGDPAQDGDGRFPNRELAETAAKTAWSVQDGQELYIVKAVRTVVSTVTGATSVTVTPV